MRTLLMLTLLPLWCPAQDKESLQNIVTAPGLVDSVAGRPVVEASPTRREAASAAVLLEEQDPELQGQFLLPEPDPPPETE